RARRAPRCRPPAAAGTRFPRRARGRCRPPARPCLGSAAMSVPTAHTGLLSRIAETLFWTGRYIERPQDPPRLVDVYVHRIVEEPRADEDAGCRAVLAVLGIQPDEDSRMDIGVALDKVAYDVSSTSAIAGAVLAARTGARSVREVISSEMWECLNVTGLRLAAKHVTAERLGPAVYLRFVRERAALFFGLADSAMSQQDALPVPGARPQPGTGGHDGQDAARPDAGNSLRARLADAAARLRRLRVLHPHPQLDWRIPACRRVPHPRPPVPPIGAARADDRRGMPDRPGPRPRPGRHGRPGPAPDRADADQARVRAPAAAAGPARRAARHDPADLPGSERGHHRALLHLRAAGGLGARRATMSARLKIARSTRVGDEEAARASYNEARITPPTLPRQSALDSHLGTAASVPIWTYSDYWGTVVSSFDIEAPHAELMIRADAVVETSLPPQPAPPLPWPVLSKQAAAGGLIEFLMPTPRTTVDEKLAASARQRTAGADPLEAAAEIASWVGA